MHSVKRMRHYYYFISIDERPTPVFWWPLFVIFENSNFHKWEMTHHENKYLPEKKSKKCKTKHLGQKKNKHFWNLNEIKQQNSVTRNLSFSLFFFFLFFLPENSGYQIVKKTMENTIIKIIIQQIKRWTH